MNVLCLDDNVDGLSKNKIYDVRNIFIRNDINLYGIIDDYGMYNEFKADRFIINEGEDFEVLISYHGITLSVKLNS